MYNKHNTIYDIGVSTADRFLQLFPASPVSFTQGTPTGTYKPTRDGRLKAEYRYFNAHRPFNLHDARLHLEGKVRIVANPTRYEGCRWGAIDVDEYGAKLDIPEDLKPWLNVYPSKSEGWHLFVFFDFPVKGEKLRPLLREWAKRIGHPNAEVFPKQDELIKHGSFINLPFFGTPIIEPRLCELPEDEWPSPEKKVKKEEEFEDDGPGCWAEDTLLAMLKVYKEFIPGFDFAPSSIGGFAVPCPGNPLVGGWPDGLLHSIEESLLNANTHVFIKNNYPKFVCFHDHCGGHTDGMSAYPKKTINNWRDYWDPDYVLFDIDEWVDEQALKGNILL